MGFSQILKEIEENDIGIYKFPELGGEDDEDVAAVSMKVCEMQCVVQRHFALDSNDAWGGFPRDFALIC